MNDAMRKRRDPQRTLFAAETSTTRSSGGGVSAQSMKRATEELEKMASANDFLGARPLHLVALYLHLHLKVYGVEATDCGPGERLAAAGRAASLIAQDFEASGAAAVEFLRWTWSREQGREKWRRENGRGGQRITWRLQFSSALVVDYKIDRARKKEG